MHVRMYAGVVCVCAEASLTMTGPTHKCRRSCRYTQGLLWVAQAHGVWQAFISTQQSVTWPTVVASVAQAHGAWQAV